MTGAPPGIARRYLGFLALVVALSAVLALVGWLPTARLGGPRAVAAMVAACAIGAAASAVAGLPLALLATAAPEQRVSLALAAMVLRLLAALVLGAAAALSGWLDSRPLLIWLAVSYLVLLAADTGYALMALRRTES